MKLWLCLFLFKKIFFTSKKVYVMFMFMPWRLLEQCILRFRVFVHHFLRTRLVWVFLKDIINTYNSLLKNANFSIKTTITNQHHISLNGQFTVVFNGIICFSVRYCDKLLLVLKMRLQVFISQAKRCKGFPVIRIY